MSVPPSSEGGRTDWQFSLRLVDMTPDEARAIHDALVQTLEALDASSSSFGMFGPAKDDAIEQFGGGV